MTKLLELRNQLVAKLRDIPGFLTVGIGKANATTVFVVSVDSKNFKGGAPKSFAGYDVLVRDLGPSIGHSFA
jgi:hypothetical protein